MTSKGKDRCAGETCFPLALDPYSEKAPTEALAAGQGGEVVVTDRQAIHVFDQGKLVRSIDPWEGEPGQVVSTAIADLALVGERILVVDESPEGWAIVVFGRDGSHRGHLGGDRPIRVASGGVSLLEPRRAALLEADLSAVHLYDATSDRLVRRAVPQCRR